jgi:hypothetical protein
VVVSKLEPVRLDPASGLRRMSFWSEPQNRVDQIRRQFPLTFFI